MLFLCNLGIIGKSWHWCFGEPRNVFFTVGLGEVSFWTFAGDTKNRREIQLASLIPPRQAGACRPKRAAHCVRIERAAHWVQSVGTNRDVGLLLVLMVLVLCLSFPSNRQAGARGTLAFFLLYRFCIFL